MDYLTDERRLAMKDRIIITGLEIFARHGVYEEEKEKGQPFVINATLETDTSKAGWSDEIDETVDYGVVCTFISDYMTKNNMNTLEALTNQLARKLLKNFPTVSAVNLEIQKPEAPIPLPFKTVSVQIYRTWHKVYVAFGSNMGDREDTIEEAIENLSADECIRMGRKSSYYSSKPYGDVEQDDFTNGVFEMDTLYGEEELLIRLKSEERKAGRVKTVHWGPRPLDLDIIYYDDEVYESENLTIPHIDMSNRDFVLAPLDEIAPFIVHPQLGLTAGEMLDNLENTYVEN